jgi:hypothetical protein
MVSSAYSQAATICGAWPSPRVLSSSRMSISFSCLIAVKSAWHSLTMVRESSIPAELVNRENHPRVFSGAGLIRAATSSICAHLGNISFSNQTILNFSGDGFMGRAQSKIESDPLDSLFTHHAPRLTYSKPSTPSSHSPPAKSTTPSSRPAASRNKRIQY